MGAVSTASADTKASSVPSRASVTLTSGFAELGDDFVLQIVVDDISRPQALLEIHPSLPNHRAIVTTLVPKFKLQSASPEIVFLADQSGSMKGDKNEALVSALKIFLKSLPFGIRFNICAFGSSFDFLWPTSQAYNEDNVTKAIQWVDGFNADYGGTEILTPLKDVFSRRLADMSLEVMLLTDGQIHREIELFSFVNKQVHVDAVDARVFSLGIGASVSHTLVEGVARAGNGFAQFVTPNEGTDAKVIRMLKGALYGPTKDYKLELNHVEGTPDGEEFELLERMSDMSTAEADGMNEAVSQEASATQSKSFFHETIDANAPIEEKDSSTAERYAHLPTIDPPSVLQSPAPIPMLYPFNRTTIYLLLGPEADQKPIKSLTLRANSKEGPLSLEIPVHPLASSETPVVHQLAARNAILELEEGRGWLVHATASDESSIKTKCNSRFDEVVEREGVRLGEKFQVASKWTSFVAIHEAGPESTNASTKIPDILQQSGNHGLSPRPSIEAAEESSDDDIGFALFDSSSFVSTRQAPTRYAESFSAALNFSDASTRSVESARAAPMTRTQASYSSAQPRLRQREPTTDDHNAIRKTSDLGDPSTRMHELVALQTFSGAWKWEDKLFRVFQMDPKKIQASALGESEDVAATALAVAFLETFVAAEREAWEMVAGKARAWLVRQVGEREVDGIVDRAAALLAGTPRLGVQ